MPSLSLPISSVIRENVATLMTYAFSRPAIESWAARWLEGEFRQLRHAMLDLPAHRAERACLELAVLVRYLDDERGLSEQYRGHSSMDFGRLHNRSGTVTALDLRDVVNKIIHASSFEWDLSQPDRPYLIALPRDSERWTRAEINVAALCVVGGELVA
jgi:hypothetical protein